MFDQSCLYIRKIRIRSYGLLCFVFIFLGCQNENTGHPTHIATSPRSTAFDFCERESLKDSDTCETHKKVLAKARTIEKEDYRLDHPDDLDFLNTYDYWATFAYVVAAKRIIQDPAQRLEFYSKLINHRSVSNAFLTIILDDAIGSLVFPDEVTSSLEIFKIPEAIVLVSQIQTMAQIFAPPNIPGTSYGNEKIKLAKLPNFSEPTFPEIDDVIHRLLVFARYYGQIEVKHGLKESIFFSQSRKEFLIKIATSPHTSQLSLQELGYVLRYTPLDWKSDLKDLFMSILTHPNTRQTSKTENYYIVPFTMTCSLFTSPIVRADRHFFKEEIVLALSQLNCLRCKNFANLKPVPVNRIRHRGCFINKKFYQDLLTDPSE